MRKGSSRWKRWRGDIGKPFFRRLLKKSRIWLFNQLSIQYLDSLENAMMRSQKITWSLEVNWLKTSLRGRGVRWCSVNWFLVRFSLRSIRKVRRWLNKDNMDLSWSSMSIVMCRSIGADMLTYTMTLSEGETGKTRCVLSTWILNALFILTSGSINTSQGQTMHLWLSGCLIKMFLL